jgi:hypothetical protein
VALSAFSLRSRPQPRRRLRAAPREADPDRHDREGHGPLFVDDTCVRTASSRNAAAAVLCPACAGASSGSDRWRVWTPDAPASGRRPGGRDARADAMPTACPVAPPGSDPASPPSAGRSGRLRSWQAWMHRRRARGPRSYRLRAVEYVGLGAPAWRDRGGQWP